MGPAGSVWLGRLALAGPIAFTAAWLVGGLVQEEYSFQREDISALAAMDAQHAWIMITGFVLLGAGTVALAAGLASTLRYRSAVIGSVACSDLPCSSFTGSHLPVRGQGSRSEPSCRCCSCGLLFSVFGSPGWSTSRLALVEPVGFKWGRTRGGNGSPGRSTGISVAAGTTDAVLTDPGSR